MTEFICSNCGDTYDRLPMGGYCDNTLACTAADLINTATGERIPADY